LEILSIDVEESIRLIIASKNTDRGVMILLNAINQLDKNRKDMLSVA
jgi:hypothetical protein